MATAAYMSGRKRYARPQGILWSENPGTLQNGIYVPEGIEVGAYTNATTNLNKFLAYPLAVYQRPNILSDCAIRRDGVRLKSDDVSPWIKNYNKNIRK